MKQETVPSELYTTEATESRNKAEADAKKVDKDPEEVKRQFEELLQVKPKAGTAHDKEE
jgi:methylphosphotriester-DNA--protein-cysteine methyltransferase